MQTLGLVEAARDAQERLRQKGLSIDERGMPREEDSPSRELNVARVGNQASTEKKTGKLETITGRSGDTERGRG